MRCEGIIAEQTIPTHSEMVETVDGHERVIHFQTTPEHPCDAEATMLSRTMREDGDGNWVRIADHGYCAVCFVPGRMEHRDGSVSQHPAMAIEEYAEAPDA